MDSQHRGGEFGEFADDRQRLTLWTDRLDAYLLALGAIDADDPFDFCADAWDIWRSAVTADPPLETSAAVLVALGGLQAVAHAMTASTLDYYRTEDIRDRMTVSVVHTSLTSCLSKLRREAGHWLDDGLPGAEEIRARSASSVASLQLSSTPGAAPISNSGIVFDKVCALTDIENRRYRDAYGRLRAMLGRESLQHITAQSENLSDVVTGIVFDLQASRGSTFDEHATAERTGKIRTALTSVTAALDAHHQHALATTSRTFGRDSAQAEAVRRLFDDTERSSFEYRWLSELHAPLQRGDTQAVRCQFTARRHGEPDVDVHMNREHMTQLARANKKWLGPDEVAVMTRDPSVLDMVKAVAPTLNSLQGQLDAILYPNVADDVAAVRELIDRFGGQKGVDALQTAPGHLQKPWMPPHLSPRVLSFVRSFD